MKDVRLNLDAEGIMFRSVSDKEYIIIKNAHIETFNHNVVIRFFKDTKVFSFLMKKYHLETKDESIVQMRNEPIHLAAENALIIIYNPIVERLELDGYSMTMNIVADYIDYFAHPIMYIRKTKIEKIKKDIDARKKSRSSSN